MKIVFNNAELVFAAPLPSIDLTPSIDDVCEAYINGVNVYNAAGKGFLIDVSDYRGREVSVAYSNSTPDNLKYMAFLVDSNGYTVSENVPNFCSGETRKSAGTYAIPNDCNILWVACATPSAPTSTYIPTIEVV